MLKALHRVVGFFVFFLGDAGGGATLSLQPKERERGQPDLASPALLASGFATGEKMVQMSFYWLVVLDISKFDQYCGWLIIFLGGMAYNHLPVDDVHFLKSSELITRPPGRKPRLMANG